MTEKLLTGTLSLNTNKQTNKTLQIPKTVASNNALVVICNHLPAIYGKQQVLQFFMHRRAAKSISVGIINQ